MENFVFVNNEFFDRVSNTPEEMAAALDKELTHVFTFQHSICGKSLKTYLFDKE